MKAVVLLSGGVDSTTCLAEAISRCGIKEVSALNIFYGQRHAKEMQAAKDIARYYGVDYLEINLSQIFKKSDCSLLAHSENEIAYGSYAEQKSGDKPVSTYVPFRNGLMLSAAASYALSVGACEVWYGAHADDVAGNAYPDCSKEFVDAINSAIIEGTANQVKVVAPFVSTNKAGVIKRGLELRVPYKLTWSCYEGREKPCGKCGTCIDRKKAFEANGIEDPALKEGK